MASFRSLKCTVVITQLLWRRDGLANLAKDGGLQLVVATRRPEHLLLALSMSSASRRDRNANEEEARVSESDTEASDDLMFLDSSQQEISGGRWELEDKTDAKDGNWRNLSWLTNMVEPAMSMYKRYPPPGELAEKWDGSGGARTFVDIGTTLLKSSAGMQQWGLSDITFGLYLLSLRHASEMAVDTIRGEKVTSDLVVQEWIYHLELAWGAYMKDAAMLARVSMLREENVVKFVSNASVMKPAYYIGVDIRHKLVIMSIRGTQTYHDLITDLSLDNEHAGNFDGEPVHYGSVEAARWFLRYEVETLKICLAENKGFRLLVIGHSLGGSTATLLGMMLRHDSQNLLGLCPDKIRVVGIGTPACVSKVLSSRCRDFTDTLVLQDDVIPRVSSSGLIRLRNEILCTDWNDVLKEGVERKGIADLVAGTMQALSSVQDAARKYGALARRTISLNGKGNEYPSQAVRTESKQEVGVAAHSAPVSVKLQRTKERIYKWNMLSRDVRSLPYKLKGSDRVDLMFGFGAVDDCPHEDLETKKHELMKTVTPPKDFPELVAPGTLFHICSRPIKTPEFQRNIDNKGCSMWKGDADTYLGRIVLSSNMLSDHRVESYYYSLRDVLKGLPISRNVTQF